MTTTFTDHRGAAMHIAFGEQLEGPGPADRIAVPVFFAR